MPDPSPQPGVSDGCGVALFLDDGGWHECERYIDGNSQHPEPTHRAFPEAEAALLVEVEHWSRELLTATVTNEPTMRTLLFGAIRHLDAARSPA